MNSLKNGNAPSKAAALEKLTKIGRQGLPASELVIGALSDRSSLVREKALPALESVNPELYPLIVTLLVDRNASKRDGALDGLRNLGEPAKPAAPMLLYMLNNCASIRRSGYNFSPSRVIDCLETICPDAPLYCEALLLFIQPSRNNMQHFDYYGSSEGNADSRPQAYRLIAEKVKHGLINPRKATEALTSALSDSTNIVVIIKSLGEIGQGAKSAIQVLTRLKLHENGSVRQAASDALDRIR
jgi:hypothetical protein